MQCGTVDSKYNKTQPWGWITVRYTKTRQIHPQTCVAKTVLCHSAKPTIPQNQSTNTIHACMRNHATIVRRSCGTGDPKATTPTDRRKPWRLRHRETTARRGLNTALATKNPLIVRSGLPSDRATITTRHNARVVRVLTSQLQWELQNRAFPIAAAITEIVEPAQHEGTGLCTAACAHGFCACSTHAAHPWPCSGSTMLIPHDAVEQFLGPLIFHYCRIGRPTALKGSCQGQRSSVCPIT